MIEGDFPKLTKERQAEISTILKSVSKGSQEFIDARNELVLSCIPWAKSIAVNYQYNGKFDLEDLISVAICGMYDVADQFDSERGTASTFFSLKINQTLQKHCWQNREVVRLPNKANKKSSKFLSDHQSKVCNGVLSLDANYNDEQNYGLKDLIIDHRGDEEGEEQGNQLDHTSRMELVEGAMVSLNERERGIIRARYLTNPRLTLSEVAEQLGVTRERVRQIEAKSIGKIKQFIEEKKMSESNGNGNLLMDSNLSVYELAQKITLLDYANIDVAIAQVDREIKIAQEESKRQLAIKVNELNRRKEVLKQLRKIAAPHVAAKRKSMADHFNNGLNPAHGISGGKISLTKDRIAQALREDGNLGPSQLGKMLGVSIATIHNHLKDRRLFDRVGKGQYRVKSA